MSEMNKSSGNSQDFGSVTHLPLSKIMLFQSGLLWAQFLSGVNVNFVISKLFAPVCLVCIYFCHETFSVVFFTVNLFFDYVSYYMYCIHYFNQSEHNMTILCHFYTSV